MSHSIPTGNGTNPPPSLRKRFGAAVLFIAALVGIPAAVAQVYGTIQEERRAATTAATAAPSPSPTPSAPSGPGSSAAAAVRCWMDPAQPEVPCVRPHRYETAPSLPVCDRPTALAYLGGVAGTDAPVFSVSESGGQGCLLGARKETTVPFQKVLAAADHAPGWRDCVDGEIGSTASLVEVGCDEPHIGEYISTADQGPADEQGCRDAAGEYMSSTLESRQADLEVRTISGISPQHPERRCLILLTNGKDLDSTLRLIANAVLPRVR